MKKHKTIKMKVFRLTGPTRAITGINNFTAIMHAQPKAMDFRHNAICTMDMAKTNNSNISLS